MKNDQDFRTACVILSSLNNIIDKVDNPEKLQRSLVDLKREMRTFSHRPVSERRIIQADGIDGYTELLPLPEYIETMDEAVSYFEDYEYRPYYPSAYDCTGQAFTSWYKVFIRGGRFWAYHRVSVDV